MQEWRSMHVHVYFLCTGLVMTGNRGQPAEVHDYMTQKLANEGASTLRKGIIRFLRD